MGLVDYDRTLAATERGYLYVLALALTGTLHLYLHSALCTLHSTLCTQLFARVVGLFSSYYFFLSTSLLQLPGIFASDAAPLLLAQEPCNLRSLAQNAKTQRPLIRVTKRKLTRHFAIRPLFFVLRCGCEFCMLICCSARRHWRMGLLCERGMGMQPTAGSASRRLRVLVCVSMSMLCASYRAHCGLWSYCRLI
jgi:hypothetical protein